MNSPDNAGQPIPLSTELTTPSPLFFGCGIESHFCAQLGEACSASPADKVFLVADQTIHALHPEFERALRRRFSTELILIEPGEAAKSWEGLEALCEQLLARSATKRSVVLAFGGGSVGNLAGLAAALLFRGIRYVEIPTTFMHLTDGVLSNKQAINGRSGKNLFGTYYAPLFVWADARYLETEPVRSRKAGLAEAVKNAMISQPELISCLRQALRRDGNYTAAQLTELALRTIHSKLAILRRDPGEKDYALVLEYGHTFGHALEWLSQGALLHGECVAVGMKMAAHLAHERGMISEQTVKLHYDLLDSCLGLTPVLPPQVNAEPLLAAMKRDNKRTGESLRFVLLEALGCCAQEHGEPLITIQDDDFILDFLHRFLGAYPEPLAARRRAQSAGSTRSRWATARVANNVAPAAREVSS